MKNYYDTKAFKKDLKKFASEVQRVATQAVKKVTVSENAFQMAFDETDVVPYGAKRSTITVVSKNDEVDLEEQIQVVSDDLLDELKDEVIEGIKEVLK